jgi:peptide/nickel transport system substrate-binding protein
MKRRTLLTAAAASLALPGIGRAASATTLRFVPAADVPSLDPVWTTASQTRDHAMLVYDTLYGFDDALVPRPQMVAGHVTEPDGLRWTLTLRDGLKFHDGERVLASDCVASIKRWGARDSFGQALLAATDELSAPDDKTILFRLKYQVPQLPAALAKYSSPCVIMPARLISGSAFAQVTDPIGSGPFRFLADQRVAGSRLGYAKFDGYVPRQDGQTQGSAGPKIAHFERIEWVIMPDGATASAALQNGEVDWLRWPLVDLLPLLRRSPGVKVAVIEPTGLIGKFRFNHLQAPFNNKLVRQAILPALSQIDYMTAAQGDDTSLWRDKIGFFTPGTPMASDVGMDALTGKRDLALARKRLKESGYSGERTVVMLPGDFPIYRAMAEVTGQLLKDIGFNVDIQSVDWATAMQRRAKPEPVEKGGWSVFHTGWGGDQELNPVTNIWLRGNGQDAAPGWPTSPAIEQLRDRWLREQNPAKQAEICAEIQKQAFDDLPYIPTGQLFAPVAYRADLTGMVNGLPAFWNIRRG